MDRRDVEPDATWQVGGPGIDWARRVACRRYRKGMRENLRERRAPFEGDRMPPACEDRVRIASYALCLHLRIRGDAIDESDIDRARQNRRVHGLRRNLEEERHHRVVAAAKRRKRRENEPPYQESPCGNPNPRVRTRQGVDVVVDPSHRIPDACENSPSIRVQDDSPADAIEKGTPQPALEKSNRPREGGGTHAQRARRLAEMSCFRDRAERR